MFNIDKAFLNQKAAESGFIRDNLEKVFRLTDVLAFINEDPLLSKLLVLKGGTAINLTVFNLPRLSVDIDLDLDYKCSREEMIEIRGEIEDTLMRYMYASNYYVHEQRQKESHSLSSWVYRYQNAGGNQDNIKVEINYSMRQHVLPSHDAIVDIGFIGTTFRVNTLSPIELFGSKIKALTERTAARDIYDVHNMIKYGIFDDNDMDMLRKCVLFYRAVGGTGQFHEEIYLNSISDLSYRTIRQTLLPVLRKETHIDLEEMKEEVLSYVSNLLVPTDSEWMFLHEFSKGNYEPSLLFDNYSIIDRVEGHPMAIWKCNKIRQTMEQEQRWRHEQKKGGMELS